MIFGELLLAAAGVSRQSQRAMQTSLLRPGRTRKDSGDGVLQVPANGSGGRLAPKWEEGVAEGALA